MLLVPCTVQMVCQIELSAKGEGCLRSETTVHTKNKTNLPTHPSRGRGGAALSSPSDSNRRGRESQPTVNGLTPDKPPGAGIARRADGSGTRTTMPIACQGLLRARVGI